MFCRNCGEVMNDNQTICLKCGVEVNKGNSFCANCGKPINPGAAVCINCGVSQAPEKSKASSDGKLTRCKEGKLLAGVYSGLGKKFDCNPWIFRILHFALCWIGIGFLLIIVYIIAAIALPYDE